ncbi:MAG: lytic transglycosylase domain-containing protein [Gammaproteobacteria bacterium]|nr:lytic transglycosylase domain-containing protein [Gammaproteobacteria bacterium]MBU2546245.1 lytic transglycosylase domain-containing protein [Gammaproteobacteria bacterium]
MVGIVISGAGICFVYPEMAKFVAATEDNFNPYAAGALGLAVGVPVTGSASLFGGLCGLCTGWFGAKAVEATKKAVEERWSPEAKRFIGS